MKTLPLPSRVLFVAALALTATLRAQSNATPPALGLLRLKSAARPNEAAPLVAGKFTVDELSAAGFAGASKARKNNVDYIALDAGKEWARPLRGNPHDVTFVSFQVYASQSTIIEIGAARLGFTASPTSGNLQLMFDDSATGSLQWKTLNFHLGLGSYDGKQFASLPTLTIRLDPITSTWDVYSGSRLLADNLPLIATRKDQRQFLVRAGSEGAWITGLVMADENPLYEDANANGIDDAFEKQKRGAILSASAALADRKALAQEWKEAQRKVAPPALYLKRPMPDSSAANTPPKK